MELTAWVRRRTPDVVEGGLLSQGTVGRLTCTVWSRKALRRGSHLSGSLDNQRIQMDPDVEEGHSVGRETAPEDPKLEMEPCIRGTKNELVTRTFRARGGRFITRRVGDVIGGQALIGTGSMLMFYSRSSGKPSGFDAGQRHHPSYASDICDLGKVMFYL